MTEDQLRVAALCGHPGAHHAVVGGEVPSNPVELVMALKGFGPKVYVRAAVAALESARPVTGESEKKRLDVVPLLKQWLESPSGGLADQIKGKGYAGGPEAAGGALAATRWAVEQHKYHEIDQRGEMVDPATLVAQEGVVLKAVRDACLAWVFDAPW